MRTATVMSGRSSCRTRTANGTRRRVSWQRAIATDSRQLSIDGDQPVSSFAEVRPPVRPDCQRVILR
jgi:hypothetical protein